MSKCLHCSSVEGNTRFSPLASLGKYEFRILLHLHQLVLCIDGATNSLHIIEHLAMHQ